MSKIRASAFTQFSNLNHSGNVNSQYNQESSDDGSNNFDSDGDSINCSNNKAKIVGRERKKKKKKQQQIQQQQQSQESNTTNSNNKTEEESFDFSCAFVTNAACRSRQALTTQANNVQETSKKKNGQSSVNSKKPETTDSEEEDVPVEPKVLESQRLAIKGNEYAHAGNYKEALSYFSEAIYLNPSEYRFYGNRSFCYDQLGDYDKALTDADQAISLSPEWPKAYFRRGRALRGLKRYGAAEKSFEDVLSLDNRVDEAVQEILNVQTLQVMEMGFSRANAALAIDKYKTVQAALDSLLSGAVPKVSLSSEEDEYELYESEEEEVTPIKANDVKLNPSNPEGLTSLWVGNVLPEVTEKQLKSLFTKQGDVVSVHIMKEKFCAFVNFKDKVSAGKALQNLQGHNIAGKNLYIRFPFTAADKASGKTLPKPTPPKGTAPIGPINGDECVFWRLNGCRHGDNCRYRHIPENKGIDKAKKK